MRFIDTNIFLRHLTRDDPSKAEACRELFRQVEQGAVEVWTSDLVVSEVVYVLAAPTKRNGYGYSRETIRDGFLPLLSLKGLSLPAKALYPRIFELYVTLKIDFADAYSAALVEASPEAELYSYDADFDQIQGIKRLEPGNV